MSEIKLLAEMVRRQKELDKRVARLETLEFSSYVGGWVEIETVTVNTTVNSISILNIPQIFLHLFLMINGRTDQVPCGLLSMRMNNDSGNNYWHHRGQAGGSCVLGCGTSFTALTDRIAMGNHPGTSYSLDPLFDEIFGVCTVWIPDYRNQYKHKSVLFDNYWVCADAEEISASIMRAWGGGTWHSNAVITRLDLPVRFIKNSKITLYGIGGTFEEHA